MQNDTRVSDADREAVAARLREHYAAGRLSLDEFQDRLDAVYRAQVAGELNMVTDGLPHEGVVIPPGTPWGGYQGGAYSLDIEQMRAGLARAGRRIMLAFGLMTGGALLLLGLLITAFMVHGGVLGVVVGVLLAILATGVVAVAGLVWLARRAVAAARLDRSAAAGDWPAVAGPGGPDGPLAAHRPRAVAAAHPVRVPRLTVRPARIRAGPSPAAAPPGNGSPAAGPAGLHPRPPRAPG